MSGYNIWKTRRAWTGFKPRSCIAQGCPETIARAPLRPSGAFRGEREGPLAHRRGATRQAHARVRREGREGELGGAANRFAGPPSPCPLPRPAGPSGEIEGQLGWAFYPKFCLQEPLARARPRHPRLEPATISAPKTWVAGPSRTKSGHGDPLWLHRIVTSQPPSIPRTALRPGGRG